MLCEVAEGIVKVEVDEGLNPYSNGICSVSKTDDGQLTNSHLCLNPYSNGICSVRKTDYLYTDSKGQVLILILMEYAL